MDFIDGKRVFEISTVAVRNVFYDSYDKFKVLLKDGKEVMRVGQRYTF